MHTLRDGSAVVLREKNMYLEKLQKICESRRQFFQWHLPCPLGGVKWSKREPEKCTSAASLNHIYKSVQCVLYFTV